MVFLQDNKNYARLEVMSWTGEGMQAILKHQTTLDIRAVLQSLTDGPPLGSRTKWVGTQRTYGAVSQVVPNPVAIPYSQPAKFTTGAPPLYRLVKRSLQ